MIESKSAGPQVFELLLSNWALQDSRLVSIALEAADGTLRARLRCIPQFPETRVFQFVELHFSDVCRFDFDYSLEQGRFYLVNSYLGGYFDGLAYLSLDPYDYTKNTPDDRDCAVIVAAHVSAVFGGGE